MDVRAAVAWEAGQPLVVETVQLEGPKAGEVLIEIKATGVCHTDEYTRSGADPEGLFPVIFGHEGAGIVVEVGPGVRSLRRGDHVIPLYTPECRECTSCLSRKTNLCTAIRATQGQGVMPDGTSRFSINGRKLHHYMGCSTFANFTVINTAKVEPGANVVLFGLGGIGLNVIQGARIAGAGRIIGVDLNPRRRPGDPHAAVPAGDRPGVEGHGLRRRARAHRCAEDRGLVHGRPDQHRRPDHA